MDNVLIEFLKEHPSASITMFINEEMSIFEGCEAVDIFIRIGNSFPNSSAYKRITFYLNNHNLVLTDFQLETKLAMLKKALDDSYIELEQFIERKEKKNGD